MSNDEHAAQKDMQQAEVFDALGHPTRIVILKALSEGPAGFAELKKKTGIESSGHLLHHLNKLNGLVKQTSTANIVFLTKEKMLYLAYKL